MRPSNRVFSECCDGITRQQPSSLPKKLHNGLGRAAHRPRSGPFGAIPYNMRKGFAQLLGIWSWRLAPILSQSAAWPFATGSEVGPATRFLAGWFEVY